MDIVSRAGFAGFTNTHLHLFIQYIYIVIQYPHTQLALEFVLILNSLGLKGSIWMNAISYNSISSL